MIAELHEEQLNRKHVREFRIESKLGWNDPVRMLPAEIGGVRYFNKAKDRDQFANIKRRVRDLKMELKEVGLVVKEDPTPAGKETAKTLSVSRDDKKGWRVHLKGSSCAHVTGKWAFLAKERTVRAVVFGEVEERFRCHTCHNQFKDL